MNKSDWLWMPHPAHLCVAAYCRFHLATFIPAPKGIHSPAEALRMVEDDSAIEEDVMSLLHHGVIVSTVGEWVPDSEVREILARTHGIVLKGKGDAREADWLNRIGFQEIGCNRKYETMVFRAMPREDGECCPWTIQGYEIDMSGYNDPVAATQGHYAACGKWHEKLLAMKPASS